MSGVYVYLMVLGMALAGWLCGCEVIPLHWLVLAYWSF